MDTYTCITYIFSFRPLVFFSSSSFILFFIVFCLLSLASFYFFSAHIHYIKKSAAKILNETKEKQNRNYKLLILTFRRLYMFTERITDLSTKMLILCQLICHFLFIFVWLYDILMFLAVSIIMNLHSDSVI